MTQDEIIEIARKAGFVVTHIGDPIGTNYIMIEAFAKLVASKVMSSAWTQEQWTEYEKAIAAVEREANIKIIKETPFSNWFQADVIEAIRARGEQA